MTNVPPDLRYVEEREVGGCYALMRQLRPDLGLGGGIQGALAPAGGPRLPHARPLGGRAAARLGGDFRVLESFVHGRFLYVDDLVTDESDAGMATASA